MLKQAIQYIKRGWHVFPCAVNGKTPAIANGFKQASIDEDKVNKMFSDSQFNIGIATGHSSGIFVVDVDIKKTVNGEESLKQIETAYGNLPKTLESRTASGGRHLYFKYPEGVTIGNRSGLRPGLDVRGEGGYVLAPFSKIDNQLYVWINEEDIASAPDWLLTVCKEKKTTSVKNTTEIVETERNSTLTSFAGRLRQVGSNKEEIIEALLTFNESRCKPPLARDEVITIATSVARYENDDSYTDIWVAELFGYEHQGKICFCDKMGGWFFWNRRKWMLDDELNIMCKLKGWLKAKLVEAKTERDTVLYQKIKRVSSDKQMSSILNLAKSEEGILVKAEEFDQDPYIINCANGTIDLDKQELFPHKPKMFLTKEVSVEYNKEASCPEWTKFLNSIFLNDQDTIRYVQKSIGYSMTGSTKEQCFFVLHGIGANGKSTFLSAIRKILNDYALHTPAATLMDTHSGGIPNDVARLVGARLVTASESKSGNLAEAKIKELTGDDTITARFLRKEFFQFTPTFKIFLLTNKLPNIQGTDKGIWRRIIPIPFNLNLEEHEKDLDLSEKLAKEYEGIFAWMVEGFRLWKEEGLERAESIKKCLTIYQDDTDLVGNFISENYERVDDGFIKASEVVRDIHTWIKEHSNERMASYDIIDAMKKKGFYRAKSSTGAYIYKGLKRKAYGESGVGDI